METAKLFKKGNLIGYMDMLIAAHAQSSYPPPDTLAGIKTPAKQAAYKSKMQQIQSQYRKTPRTKA